MEGLLILLVLCCLAITFLGYSLNKSLKRIEVLEEFLEKYEKILERLSKTIATSREHIYKLDSSGHYQADDELGEFFKTLIEIQKALDNFDLTNINEQQEE